MTDRVFSQTSNQVPFTLCFVERIDTTLYDKAIEVSERLAQTYDSKTQTSYHSPYLGKGTSLTYTGTFSGVLQSRDDARQSDT